MEICPEGFIEIIEGLAKICAPDPQLYLRDNGVYEPSWAPVFYNPDMVENRDITIGVVDYFSKYQDKEFIVVDPLAATGIRGIRILLESSNTNNIRVFMSDILKKSIEIIKLNINLNRLKDNIVVEESDANELIYRLKRSGTTLSYIDIDPFGSPVPFAYAAISSVRNSGIVAFTATDLAVLQGKYRDKMFRRYGVIGTITHVSRDIAIRVLLSYIARIAFSLDRYVEPILSYTYKHYSRIYLRINNSATKASNQVKMCLKTLRICTYCGYSYIEDEEQKHKNIPCPICGYNTIIVSPLWFCKTIDKDVVLSIIQSLESMPWIQKTTKTLLKQLNNYADIDNISLRLSLLAKTIHTNTPSRDQVIQCLEELGYKAIKSYTYSDGILTTARISDVLKCLVY